METIDLHHGPYSANPPYTVVDVIGTPMSERIRSALIDFGFETFVATTDGFRATRSLEVALEV